MAIGLLACASCASLTTAPDSEPYEDVAIRDLRFEPTFSESRVSSTGYVRFPQGSDFLLAVSSGPTAQSPRRLRLIHALPADTSFDVGAIWGYLCEAAGSEQATADSVAADSSIRGFSSWSIEFVSSGFVVSIRGSDLMHDCNRASLPMEIFHESWSLDYLRSRVDVLIAGLTLVVGADARRDSVGDESDDTLVLSYDRSVDAGRADCEGRMCTFAIAADTASPSSFADAHFEWRSFPLRWDESPQFSEDGRLLGWSHPVTGRSRDRQVWVSDSVHLQLTGDTGPSLAGPGNDAMQRERCRTLYHNRILVEQYNDLGLLERIVWVSFGEAPDALSVYTDIWHWSYGPAREFRGIIANAVQREVTWAPAEQVPMRPSVDRGTYDELMDRLPSSNAPTTPEPVP